MSWLYKCQHADLIYELIYELAYELFIERNCKNKAQPSPWRDTRAVIHCFLDYQPSYIPHTLGFREILLLRFNAPYKAVRQRNDLLHIHVIALRRLVIRVEKWKAEFLSTAGFKKDSTVVCKRTFATPKAKGDALSFFLGAHSRAICEVSMERIILVMTVEVGVRGGDMSYPAGASKMTPEMETRCNVTQAIWVALGTIAGTLSLGHAD